MEVFLPKGFVPDRGRRQMSRPARVSQLRVEAGGVHYAVLRRWATGFAVVADAAPKLSGIVDLYDGKKHLRQCVVTRREEAGAEVIFTVKSAIGVDYGAADLLEGEL